MKGPPPGFSKGVNDSLVANASLVHLKAAALLGFALTLSGIVVSGRTGGGAAAALHFAGVTLLFAAAATAGAVIYPVKYTRRGGVIFWGDIAGHGSASAYAESLAKLGGLEDAEREYAFTNYRFSQVLDSKYGLIRWSVGLLLAGACLAGAGRALNPS